MKGLYTFLIYFAFLVMGSLQDECHTEQFDLCLAPVFLTARRGLVPKDQKALDSRCARLDAMWKCIDNFMDTCTAEEHHLIFDFMTDNQRMVINEFCLKGSKFQTEFLKYAPCLATAFANARHNCLNNLENLMYIVTGNDPEIRVPTGCCYFNQFYECFFNHLEAACGKEAFPVVKKSIQMMNGNYIRNLCAAYNPSGNLCMDLLSRNVTVEKNNSFFVRAMTTIIRAYH
ncbi:uncharacterized protein [Centruroides vittatus]|uniref:uncharacterized protein n=1 Tax=Centruroides vittatus TaxID=120091 RepID=UPI00350F4E8B